MKKLLLATVALAALVLPANAAIVDNLGVNPASSDGIFNNSVGGTTFSDEYIFQLEGAPLFVSFASATNVYTAPTDFIAAFTGRLFQQVGAIGGGDDIARSMLVQAVPCEQNPTGCQVLAGGALLEAGNYYLQITGIGGGTSGYGGNLTTIGVGVVPIPGMALAVPLGALGLAWFARRRKRA
jgi:hypothetical protein